MGFGLGFNLGFAGHRQAPPPPPPRPSIENWKKVDGKKLGKGGQGTTYLVKRTDATIDDNIYVIKELNKQDKEEARGRICREVAILQSLKHKGLPRLVESNASHDLVSTQIPLWVVLEYIPGGTLEHKRENGTATFAQASELFDALLGIVGYYQSNGVIHRDLKPGNIILRADAWSDPVVIDFGLGFDQNTKDEELTETSERFGNRFLQLPEYQHQDNSKRSTASDLTSVSAIVLFALTGIDPITLADAVEHKPHRRPEFVKALDAVVPPEKRDGLDRFFDRSFRVDIARRFATIESMRREAAGVFLPAIPTSQDEGLAATLGHLASIAAEQPVDWNHASGEVMGACGDIFAQYSTKFGKFHDAKLGVIPNVSAQTSTFTYSLVPKFPRIAAVRVEVVARLVQSHVDLHFRSKRDGADHELLSFDVVDGFPREAFKTAVCAVFERTCAKELRAPPQA